MAARRSNAKKKARRRRHASSRKEAREAQAANLQAGTDARQNARQR